MQQECRHKPLTELILSPRGVVEPLCNTCKNRDCGEPIEIREVPVFGIKHEWRCYILGDRPNQVYKCEGYVA